MAVLSLHPNFPTFPPSWLAGWVSSGSAGRAHPTPQQWLWRGRRGGWFVLSLFSCSGGRGSRPDLSQAGEEAEVAGAADQLSDRGTEQLRCWRHCRAATCLVQMPLLPAAILAQPGLSLKPGFRLSHGAPAL